jgi:hypothetical protein
MHRTPYNSNSMMSPHVLHSLDEVPESLIAQPQGFDAGLGVAPGHLFLTDKWTPAV